MVSAAIALAPASIACPRASNRAAVFRPPAVPASNACPGTRNRATALRLPALASKAEAETTLKVVADAVNDPAGCKVARASQVKTDICSLAALAKVARADLISLPLAATPPVAAQLAEPANAAWPCLNRQASRERVTASCNVQPSATLVRAVCIISARWRIGATIKKKLRMIYGSDCQRRARTARATTIAPVADVMVTSLGAPAWAFEVAFTKAVARLVCLTPVKEIALTTMECPACPVICNTKLPLPGFSKPYQRSSLSQVSFWSAWISRHRLTRAIPVPCHAQCRGRQIVDRDREQQPPVSPTTDS